MIRTCRHVNPQKEKMLGGIHPYWELLYVISGQVQLQWMGESFLLQPQSLILLYPSTPHQVTALTAECSFWFAELDAGSGVSVPDLEQSIVWNRQQSAAASFYIDEPAYGVTLNLLTSAICSGSLEASDYNRKIAALDFQKLLLIIKARLDRKSDAPASSDPSAADEAVVFLMRYMETEYNKPLTLAAMSELTHFNPSYLIRIFKRCSGVTPAQYLQSLRLNAAACFLSATGLSVEEIALRCGYRSIHYFSQSFKKNFGVSPSLWRCRMNLISRNRIM
ncbi:helix-turn-helix domain-containing protein [Paenibacillus piri]|uniref:AraC family transcriptional regulator n=1 Tax=Paenibacillus piri TaxID=2547395 RepID=A0A4R5KSK1_9BACL|nr:helix-turn-helix domain-containing protein [Paenibacillus piri]TDF98771.1 AraC family transcriptional regulator [Paenibacillus piri]